MCKNLSTPLPIPMKATMKGIQINVKTWSHIYTLLIPANMCVCVCLYIICINIFNALRKRIDSLTSLSIERLSTLLFVRLSVLHFLFLERISFTHFVFNKNRRMLIIPRIAAFEWKFYRSNVNRVSRPHTHTLSVLYLCCVLVLVWCCFRCYWCCCELAITRSDIDSVSDGDGFGVKRLLISSEHWSQTL